MSDVDIVIYRKLLPEYLPFMPFLLILCLILLLLNDIECFLLPNFNSNFRTSTDSRLYKKAPRKSKHPQTTMVKLRYDVDLVGKAGEVKTVSNAMWMNMLQRRRLAFKVEKHHLETWAFNDPEARKARKEGYRQLFTALSALPRLNIHSHVGKDNLLLYSVSGKVVLDEIRKTVPHSLTAKSIVEAYQLFTIDNDVIRKEVNMTEGLRLMYSGDYELAIKINRGVELVKILVNVSPHPWTTSPVSL